MITFFMILLYVAIFPRSLDHIIVGLEAVSIIGANRAGIFLSYNAHYLVQLLAIIIF